MLALLISNVSWPNIAIFPLLKKQMELETVEIPNTFLDGNLLNFVKEEKEHLPDNHHTIEL